MELYNRDCRKDKGAILFGVARGKYSEGFDSKNEQCRGLFIIGVPNLNSKLPNEIIKRRIKSAYCYQ